MASRCTALSSPRRSLESGWGESKLSAKYHNYFGLKCGTKWTGPSVNMTTQEEYQPGVHTHHQGQLQGMWTMEEGVKGTLNSSAGKIPEPSWHYGSAEVPRNHQSGWIRNKLHIRGKQYEACTPIQFDTILTRRNHLWEEQHKTS